ncbi:restriction endonuclease subunit S [Flavobacterium sp. GSP6]|uniref:restriction endonuclease subunit S n=1 Tax=Flavobacterium sp. GSP6 TaxID=2497488 RepID=UPI000F85BA5F|nr:restriction endonuclease subunit S [Flavobacterium sp. GSP6]RTZ09268.1 restriction endonuclease subunit S [Flavobacterium sp. GSP6]
MEKLKNIPTLRFPEFKGEWKSKKLGEVAKIGRGKSKHRPRNAGFLYGGIYPFLQTGDIRNAGLYLSDYTQTYSEAGLKQSKLWPEETLCITIAANIAETSILKIKACFPDSIIGLIPKENETTVLFVKNLFDKFKIQIQNLSQGAAQDNLNQEKLTNIEFQFPNITEQQKIATFLTTVDEKLQALKQKKSLLEQYKKGVMQKIFSQELRFKDDNGNAFADWEEKKLGECLDYLQPTKYLVSSTEYDNSFSTPVLTAGKTFILGYTNETNGIFENNLPVIIFDDFTTATQFVDFPFKAKSSAMKILVACEGIDIKFIYEAMQIMNYEIGGHERHWISKFAPIDILIPCLEEQTKIATFLSTIDEKINECQAQITNTEVWKKGLLQGMFV